MHLRSPDGKYVVIEHGVVAPPANLICQWCRKVTIESLFVSKSSHQARVCISLIRENQTQNIQQY